MTAWNAQTASVTVPLFGSAGYGCIPVHTGPLSDNISRFRHTRIPGDQRAALKEARENVTYAYFTSNVDREIDRMFKDLMELVKSGGEVDEGYIRKQTDKCYTTISMMLAEA